MKSDEFKERLISELPELDWNDRLFGSYFINEFKISAGFLEINISPELLRKKFSEMFSKDDLLTILGLDDEEYGEMLIEAAPLTPNLFSTMISAIKSWMQDCDDLRKSKKPAEDQILLIHPDCDIYTIPRILKDVKAIVGKEYDWRAGVISTADWNFESEELKRALAENSGDCLGIGPAGSWEMEIIDFDALEKVYPGAKGIKKIYTSDWD